MSNKVNRRSVLKSASAGIAVPGISVSSGCTSRLPSGQSAACQASRFTVERDTSTESGFNSLEIDLNERYERHDVKVVGAITQQPSEDSPGKVKIVFATLGESSRKFQFGATPPYSPDWGEHTESAARMVLIPEDLDEFDKVSIYDANGDGELTPVPDQPTDECWQLTDMISRLDVFVAKTLGPCQTMSTTYEILGHPDDERCLPRGEYQFEDSWYVGDDLETEIPLEATVRVEK